MAQRGKKDCDDALIFALASGASAAAAAQQAKCSERTVRRRLEDAAFRAKVGSMRSEMVQAAVGRLATLGTIAADELYRLIQKGKDDNVKLGACRAVLTYMLAGHGQETLAREVAELRRQLEESSDGIGDHPQAGSGDQGPVGRPPAGGDGASGPAAGGPGEDPGNDDAGPVAGDITPIFR
jgi:hypothetical protein